MILNIVTECSAPVGTYFRSHNLGIGLARLGHTVRVFTLDHDPRAGNREEVRDGLLYRICRSSKGQRFFGAASHPVNALRRAASDYGRADRVHLFQPFLSGTLAWYRQIWGTRSTAWYDWDDLWENGLLRKDSRSTFQAYWNYFWTSTLERRLPAFASRTTTCSVRLSNEAQQRGAISPVIIRNGFWPSPVPDRRVARIALNLDPEAQFLGFMGRTVIGEELEWCLRAFATVCPTMRNLRLALCGVTSQSISHWSERLRSRVDVLGIVDPERAKLFARSMDLGLVPLEDHPVNWSRFPVRFAHFLAAQTPVLVSAIGDLAGFSALSGVVLAGRGEERWSKAFVSTVKALSDRALPSVDVEAVETLFSWELLAKQLERAYGESA